MNLALHTCSIIYSLVSAAVLQVSAGADVLLTQPPLDWGAFELWMTELDKRGVIGAARLVIGFPLLSSSANLAFWMTLSQANDRQQCRHLLQQFQAAEQQGEAAFQDWAYNWNKQLLTTVRLLLVAKLVDYLLCQVLW